MLTLFSPYVEPREVLDQDIVYVGGGSTANLLALWRLHGVDRRAERRHRIEAFSDLGVPHAVRTDRDAAPA